LGDKHADGVRTLVGVRRDAEALERLASTEVDADTADAPLDDLAVLVLFSVFEAVVRTGLLEQLTDAVSEATHPVIRKAVDDAKQGVEGGSFFNNVLVPYKVPGGVDPDLIEQVNQVRKYRNFVAHGRRGHEPAAVSPLMAYKRLTRYLTALGLTPPAGGPRPAD
jgi:hypothetical protein